MVFLTAFAFRARPEVLKICFRWREWFMTRQLLRETSLTGERGRECVTETERDLTCKLLGEKKIKYHFFWVLEMRNYFNDFWIEMKLHLLELSEFQCPSDLLRRLQLLSSLMLWLSAITFWVGKGNILLSIWHFEILRDWLLHFLASPNFINNAIRTLVSIFSQKIK